MDNIYSANHTTVQTSCVVTNPTGSIRYLFLGTSMLAIALQRIMYALIVVLILVSAKQYFCLYENRDGLRCFCLHLHWPMTHAVFEEEASL